MNELLFFPLNHYPWTRITNTLYFCFPQMSANDCQDPPNYWTIHGLWYDHRVFLFQPGKEKINFCTRMFSGFFWGLNLSVFMISWNKSLHLVGNQNPMLLNKTEIHFCISWLAELLKSSCHMTILFIHRLKRSVMFSNRKGSMVSPLFFPSLSTQTLLMSRDCLWL